MEPLRLSSGILVSCHLPATPVSWPANSHLDPVLQSYPAYEDERVRLVLRLSFHFEPSHTLVMTSTLHSMMGRVQNDSEMSEPFEVTKGVKQACVLAPMLFSIIFTALLTVIDAFQDSEDGVHFIYRTDAKVFNH